MTRRLVARHAGRALAIGMALWLAGAAQPAASQQVVNLRDADIRMLIDDVARATGSSFVVDPRVQGRVSLVTDRPVGPQGYFELFLAALRANNFVAVPLGRGQYRIQPAEPGAGAGQPGGDRFVTSVIPLTTLEPGSAVESLRPVLSRSGTAAPSRSGNAVIITDFADNVARARAVLQQLDRDRQTTRVVALANASPRDLAQSLQTLMTAGRGEAAGPAPAAVVPAEGSQAVLIRGEPAMVARLAAMAAELDERAASGAETRVIFLEHAEAAAIMPVLQQLLGQPVTQTAPAAGLGSALVGTPFAGQQGGGGQGNGAEGGPPMGGAGPAASTASLGVAAGPPGRRVIIARYEGANALIIAAPPPLQRELADVIRQLDRVRQQVQVEAIIVELSDTAARNLGVQFLLSGTEGSTIPFLATNYTNAAPNLLAIAGAIAAERGAISRGPISDALEQAAVASLLGTGGLPPPTGINFGLGTALGSNGVFGFILNAVQSDVASNILSTPSVLTLDNQPARILVGQEIPVTTGEALGQDLQNSFRTVNRQDVGIQLAVRPQINAGGTIKLDIRQTVSSIAQTVAGRDFVLNKREIETAVTVGDGEIVALGGLLDDNERRAIQRVPLLGDVPVVGELFRSRTRQRQKTNLMVFIRPTIVRDRAGAEALTAARWDQIRAQQVAAGGVSSLDRLAWEYLRTPPPYQPPPFPPPPAQPQPLVEPWGPPP